MDFVYVAATVLFFALSWRFVRFCDAMDTARAESPREEPK
jgi:hypothetical protein